MKLVLGIDGGGTQTRAALVQADGRVLGVGVAGPSNYGDIGVEATRENISRAIQAAWGDQPARPADAAFFGLGNIVSEADRQTIRDIASTLRVAERIEVDHDIRIALAGGLAGEPGIALIMGTGSACYGRSADGCEWRAGGWGPLLDDAGSGYYLGLQAMIAAVRAADGRGAPTKLTEALMRKLSLADMHQIMRRVYHDGLSRTEIAAMSSLVIDAARAGDDIAQAIIERGVHELAWMIATVARKLNFSKTTPVCATGGLTQAGEVILKPLRKATPHPVSEPILPPVLGAALLVMDTKPIEALVEQAIAWKLK